MSERTAKLFFKTTNNVPALAIDVDNGNFNGSLNGWTYDSSDWKYSSGRAYGNFGGVGELSQTLSNIQAGNTYYVEFYIKFISTSPFGSGSVTVSLGDDTSTSITKSGWYKLELTPTSGNVLQFDQNIFFKGYIDAVSVRNKFGTEVDSYEEVDLFDDDIISLTFNRVDINDITRRSSTYSKTITLPGTALNNKIFDHLHDINVDDTEKYLNKKIPCYLYYNDYEIVNGTFELEKISFVENSKDIQYEGILYSNIKTFANEVQDKLLTGNDDFEDDLDFGAYDHELSLDNIISTWTFDSGYGSGYHYPVINYANLQGKQLEVEDLRPALYVKEIWDKIFEDAGFTYTSTFLNSEDFSKLLCPFVGDMKTPPSVLESRKVKVGLTSDYVNTGLKAKSYGYPTSSPIPLSDETNLDFYDNGDNWNTGSPNAYTIPNRGVYKFTGAITSSFEWGLEYENLAQGHYILQGTSDSGVEQSAYIKYTAELRRIKGNGQTEVLASNDSKVFLTEGAALFFIVDSVNGIALAGGTLANGVTNNNGKLQTPEISLVVNSGKITLEGGDKIYLAIKVDNTGAFFRQIINGQTIGSSAIGQYVQPTVHRVMANDANIPATYFYAESYTGDMLFEGDTIFMNNVLPRSVKQIDFVSSIINMFNLVVDEDPDNPTNLIIDTRPNYFSGGTTLDWTQKMDRGQGMDIQRIPTLVGKNVKFSYEDDNDKYNEDYLNNFEETYGNKKVLNTDKTQEDYVIDVIFAPTPSDYLPGTDIIVPQLYKTSGGENEVVIQAYKPRILYRTDINLYTSAFQDQIIEGNNYIQIKSSNNTYYVDSGVYYTASHFDNPYDPTLDLNFGFASYYHRIPNNTPPYGNIYNKYWREWIEQILDTDSKMITAYFKLTEQDIFNFNFKDQIQIDGQYFIVNKIEDWRPNELTKVELLKLVSANLPQNTAEEEEDVNREIQWGRNRWEEIKRLLEETSKMRADIGKYRKEYVYETKYEKYTDELRVEYPGQSGQNIYTGNTSVFTDVKEANRIDKYSKGFASGEENKIANVKDFEVTGQRNTLEGGRTINVKGEDNIIESSVENLSILGSRNTVKSNVRGSTIIGNDQVVNQGDSVFIGGENIFLKGNLQKQIHIITPGGNPLNPFNRHKQAHVVFGMDVADGVRTLKPSVDETFVVDSTSTPFYGLQGTT